MESHPYANLFPMMVAEETSDLTTDIKQNGFDVLRPVVTYQGKILDGRNRFAACQKLKVKPAFREFVGDDQAALAFVLSANLHRRHLTSSQRQAISADLANMPRGLRANMPGSSGMMTREAAAKVMNVSQDGLERAKTIKKADPALHERVKKGEITINAAHKEVKAKKAAAEPKAPPEAENYVIEIKGKRVHFTRAEVRSILKQCRAHLGE